MEFAGLLLVPPAVMLASVATALQAFQVGDPVGSVVLALLAAPMLVLWHPRPSLAKTFRKSLPAFAFASLATSTLFMVARPDLTDTILGDPGLLQSIASLVERSPPPVPAETVKTQLAVIDDILDLLDD